MNVLNEKQFNGEQSAHCSGDNHVVTYGQLCQRNENAPIQDHGPNFIYSRDQRYSGVCVKHCGHGPMAHA